MGRAFANPIHVVKLLILSLLFMLSLTQRAILSLVPIIQVSLKNHGIAYKLCLNHSTDLQNYQVGLKTRHVSFESRLSHRFQS